jgi:hypothetical protein
MSDSDVISNIENAAEAAMHTLIPERSKSVYQATYDKFEKWCKEKKVVTITEKVVLAYFSQASTLWSNYSMLQTTIYVKKNVDISKYSNVVAFLKRQ